MMICFGRQLLNSLEFFLIVKDNNMAYIIDNIF